MNADITECRYGYAIIYSVDSSGIRRVLRSYNQPTELADILEYIGEFLAADEIFIVTFKPELGLSPEKTVIRARYLSVYVHSDIFDLE